MTTHEELESEIARLRVALAEYVRCEQFGVREVIAQAERAGITWDKAQEIVASIIVREAEAKADLMVYNERRLWQAIARAAELMERDRCGWQEVRHTLEVARAAGLTWQKKP